MILSDHIGRKLFTYAGLALHLVCNILMLFIRSPSYLYIYTGLMGLRTPIASHVPYMLLVELTSSTHRPIFGLLNSGFNGFSTLIIALLYLYISNWYIIFIINSV